MSEPSESEPYTPHTIPPAVLAAVESLPLFECRVITLRLGFTERNGSVPYGEIGKRLQLEHVLVRRHELNGLDKLRKQLPAKVYETFRLTLGHWYGVEGVSDAPIPAA